MTLPVNMWFIRHGLSEGNFVQRQSERGEHALFQALHDDRDTRHFRLMGRGREQARAAGLWLSDNRVALSRYYVSEYLRARETAALLGLPGAQWRIVDRLNERDAGEYHRVPHEERKIRFPGDEESRRRERYYWRPPGGESLYDLTQRLDRFLGTLHRECSEKNVVVVCHGEVMWMFRKLLFRLTANDFGVLHDTEQLHNGEIHQYSRENPHDPGDLRSYVTWFRRIRPLAALDERIGPWVEIVYQKYTNEELLADVEKTIPLVTE